VLLPNLNPPIWTMIYLPLTEFPVEVAAVIWAIGSVIALFGGFLLATRDGGLGAWRSWRGIAVLGGPIIWETLAQGQVYTFLIAPLAAATLALRRRQLAAAAAYLGLAIALKPPLFVIAVALAWGNRRLAIWTAIMSAFWSFLPLPFVGYRPYLGWLRVSQMAPLAEPHNASLTALAARWGSHSLMLAAAVLLVLCLALASYRLRDAEAAIVMGTCVGLAASPIAWPTYFALLVPGFLWLGRFRRFSMFFDVALVLGSVPLFVFLASPLSGVPIYAIALLGFCIEVLVACERRAAAARASVPQSAPAPGLSLASVPLPSKVFPR
jgi:alpha-1,2-mannosyltransferase